MYTANKWQITLLSAALLAVLSCDVEAAQRCDPNKPESTPLTRFIVNEKQGIAFDIMTKLTWKICAEGIAYSNGHCTGDMNFTWDDANKIFGNQVSGWRLPSIDELKSIVEQRCVAPAINLQAFPDTQPSSFWSANTDPGDSDYAYNIFWGRGLVGNDLKTRGFYVRLVIGEPWVVPKKVSGKK